MNKKGITLLELMVVVAIIGILIAGGASAIFRTRNSSTVKAGINRVFMLKNAFDMMSKECGGYPARYDFKDYGELARMIDNTNGLPEIYPSGRQCDSVNLQKLVAQTLSLPTCAEGDKACASSIRANNGKRFNSYFVDGGECSASNSNHATGWNYTLAADTENPTARPVAVVCANILHNPGKTTGSVTVVLNSAGVFNGTQTANNSGMIDMTGTLSDGCPCGAYCRDNVSGKSGCCQSCTDPNTGISHSGIGFNYR